MGVERRKEGIKEEKEVSEGRKEGRRGRWRRKRLIVESGSEMGCNEGMVGDGRSQIIRQSVDVERQMGEERKRGKRRRKK